MPTPHGWICTKYVVAVYLADIIACVNFYSNWLKGFYFMVVKILPLSTDLRYRGITIDEGVSCDTVFHCCIRHVVRCLCVQVYKLYISGATA